LTHVGIACHPVNGEVKLSDRTLTMRVSVTPSMMFYKDVL